MIAPLPVRRLQPCADVRAALLAIVLVAFAHDAGAERGSRQARVRRTVARVGLATAILATAPIPIPSNDFSIHDAQQTFHADCVLFGALASLIHFHRELVERAIIRERADGRVTVRLWRRRVADDPTLGFDPVDVELPRARAGSHRQPRAELVAEAFGELHVRDFIPYALAHEALLGRPSGQEIPLRGASPQAVFTALSTATRDGAIVVARTPDVLWSGRGIEPFHEYTVLAAGLKDGIPHVRLRNPYGAFEPGLGFFLIPVLHTADDGQDDGVFTIPLDVFMKRFRGYIVTPVGPPLVAPPS